MLPQISVIMPVYNSELYVGEAIQSILDQSLSDFELIIINDGSTDESSTIAHSYTDKRIKILDLPHVGCYPARNAGMRSAQGKYIAVMDADDICQQQRLELQYHFLEQNPEIGMIGGAYQYVTGSDIAYRETEHEIIKLMLLHYCYLHHPTCMVRASLITKYCLCYNEKYVYASDYDWQVKASSLFSVGNINESILLHRRHDGQISLSKKDEQIAFADQIRIFQLSFLNIIPNEEEKMVHLSLIKDQFSESVSKEAIDRWVFKLLKANKMVKYYRHRSFQDFLGVYRHHYINQYNPI